MNGLSLKSPLLHLTLLTLFQEGERTRAIPCYARQAIERVERFFKDKNIKPFEVKFNLIRPGAWYVENKHRNLLGDGTIVAMGDLNDEYTRKFAQMGKDLANYFKYQLPNIFGLRFEAKI